MQSTKRLSVYSTADQLCTLLAWQVSSDPEARRWLVSHGREIGLLTIVASSRLDMLAILRLRICGRSLVAMPMSDQHFHFIRTLPRFPSCSRFPTPRLFINTHNPYNTTHTHGQHIIGNGTARVLFLVCHGAQAELIACVWRAGNSGLYHHLIEDTPHAVVGLAQLFLIRSCSSGAGGESWLKGVTGVDERTITLASTVVSVVSIVFGLANKSMQLLLLGPVGDELDTARWVATIRGLSASLRGRGSLLGQTDAGMGGPRQMLLSGSE